MAINYYCSIALQGSNLEFNKNQLIQPVIENSASQPASPVQGQMYFDTTVGDKKMYFYDGAAWVEMDGSGSGVASLTINNALSTYVDLTNSGTAENPILDADLNATGTASNATFLRGDNVWATPAGAYTSWSLEGDTGSAINITDGLRVDFTGGTGIATEVSAGTPNKLNIDLANTAVTPGAYTNASITVDQQGRLTAASSGTAPVTNVTAGAGLVETGAATTPTISVDYVGTGNVIDAAPDGTNIATVDKILYEDASDTTVKEIAVSSLIALGFSSWSISDGTSSTTVSNGQTVTIEGRAANSSTAGISVDENTRAIKLDLSLTDINAVTSTAVTSDLIGVTSANANFRIGIDDLHLNQFGAAESAISMGGNQIDNLADPTAAQDAATKAYVDGLVSGGLTFKGTFRADTGAIVSGVNSGSQLYNCPGGAGTRVAVAVGDYYIVATAGGSFYCSGSTLDIGDSIIATTAASADSSTAAGWSIVQSDEGVSTFQGTFGTFLSGTNISTPTAGDINIGNIDLNATGSASSATFLRGDNVWATPTNTVYTAGIGLSLSGTVFNANVDGTNSVAANASSTTTARTYKVQVDSSDKLVVNVPWSDTTGAVTSVDKSADNNRKGIFVDPTTGAVKVGLDIIGQANLTGISNSDDFIVYDASTTTNKRVGFDVIKAAVPNQTITLSGDVEGSGTTAITTTITADAVEASMLNNNVISGQTAIGTVAATDELLISDAGTIKRADVSQLADVIHAANGFAATITAFGTVTHNLNSFDVVVQLYDDTTKETVQACVDRTSVNAVAVSGNSFPAGDIRVLVSKVS